MTKSAIDEIEKIGKIDVIEKIEKIDVIEKIEKRNHYLCNRYL